MNIHLAPVTLEHAQRYYQMLVSQKYVFFGLKVQSREELVKFLETQQELYQKKALFRSIYSIFLDDEIVGSVWITRSYPRLHIGEITYFIDEKHWGRGIATQAVRMLEKIGFEELACLKLTIVIKSENKASEKVALKAGYIKEAVLRGEILSPDNELVDAILYGKLKSEYTTEVSKDKK